MKNNKGFSLVEILGVIVVLSLLTVASFTVLDGVAKRNTNKSYNIQLGEILDGAINYTNSTKGINLPSVEETTGCTAATINSADSISVGENICKLTINLQVLFDEGILDENLKNPKTKKKISGTSTIEITYLRYNQNSSVKLKENQKISGRNLYTFTMIEE